jgi:FAD/FMN-containing dehydrogenase/Fe-S oxidoreductase
VCNLNQEIIHDLGKLIDGEVRTDRASRILYSTDASIYQIEPLGVVFPRSSDDLIGVVEFAYKHNIPIIPRGAGTSLAGQAVGSGLVIDCSRYLNELSYLDAESRTAVVEPGLVLDDLNLEASRYGLKFGPDPASSDRATLGGMIGNNSTGAHSILYGMTSDQILSLDSILSDGTTANFNNIPVSIALDVAKKPGLEGDIYRASLHIRENKRILIQSNWPKTWRRSSGYGLNYLLPWSSSAPPLWHGVGNCLNYPPIDENHINLAPVMVGSEGTLAITKRAKIKLVQEKSNKVLGILPFGGIAQACDVVPTILDLKPSAVELIPRELIQRARSIPAYASRLSFVKGDPEALLVIEFEGDNRKSLLEKVKKLGSNVIIAETEEQQNQVWAVRKVGLGLLMSISGDFKPLPFVEDVAVPVEKLGAYVRSIEHILRDFRVEGHFYAHASAGCLHFRPLINLKSRRGVSTMRDMASAVAKLTIKLGGSISGEHGDGLARSEWLEIMYGKEIVELFYDLKNAADPTGILNPGKKINPQPMDQNLRYGPNYQSKEWPSIFDFSSQDSLLGAIEMCNGAGVCLSSSGLMCPSYQVTREEMHSTRGRANLLRSMISDETPLNKSSLEMVFKALDLCLECKACNAECPSAVDVAKLKYEFLNFYYCQNPRPLRDYIFAYIGELLDYASTFLGVINFFTRNKLGKLFLDYFLGLTRHRDFPIFRKGTKIDISRQEEGDYRENVIVLTDPFTEYVYPEIKQSVLKIFDAVDCRPYFLPIIGAGRTMISRGFLTEAKKHAQRVVDEIKKFDPGGIALIIGLEPSENTCLYDEYLAFFPNDQYVERLTERTYSIEEFLIRMSKDKQPRYKTMKLNGNNFSVLIHGHCYQKSQALSRDGFENGVSAAVKLFEGLGCQVEVVDAGCCGMAGAFGYESNHYDISMRIGEEKMFPAIRAKREEQIIIAPGGSCRTQIMDGTGHVAKHPIEVITELIKED